jgi:hypothetical protein
MRSARIKKSRATGAVAKTRERRAKLDLLGQAAVELLRSYHLSGPHAPRDSCPRCIAHDALEDAASNYARSMRGVQ